MTRRTATRLRLSALPSRAPTAFEIVPDAETTARLRDRLGLAGLRKVRLEGEIAPAGREDWHLSARLGATVVQPCSITLDPVTTRIEEEVTRRYLADWVEPDDPEAEMPEDDDAEALPDSVDLMRVLEESLALALPAFPRAEGAELGAIEARPPGAAPIEEEEAEKPFASLMELKRKLDN